MQNKMNGGICGESTGGGGSQINTGDRRRGEVQGENREAMRCEGGIKGEKSSFCKSLSALTACFRL